MKRCNDCRFFRPAGFDNACRAFMRRVTETSPVDGKTRTILRGNEETAEDMRSAGIGKCGPDARLFQPRSLSTVERVLAWLSAKLVGRTS